MIPTGRHICLFTKPNLKMMKVPRTKKNDHINKSGNFNLLRFIYEPFSKGKFIGDSGANVDKKGILFRSWIFPPRLHLASLETLKIRC